MTSYQKSPSIPSIEDDISKAVRSGNFNTSVKKHLSVYKSDNMKIFKNGYYEKKTYAHILPDKKDNRNILNKYNGDFFKSCYSEIKLHDGFSHLNSSQAMCINYFYPLIKTNY